MRCFSLRRVNIDASSSKDVFLTFDDGPEPGITEFVLNQLKDYGFKATFFCTGQCAEKHPELLLRIKDEGHLVGNHTYEHIKAYDRSGSSYIADVEKANCILNTSFFRPPNGCLTLKSWWGLRKYKVIYWTIGSNDWCHTNDQYEKGLQLLQSTRPGDIILFHFSNELEKGTYYILPKYLAWLRSQGLVSKALPE